MRAVIADDELLLREGVARLLEEAGIEVVAQAGDAPDLLRKVAAHKPDVAIVDIRMPPDLTDDGLRAAIEIRRRQPEVGVVVLSQHLVERFVAELVGDDPRGVGYLLKHRVADLGYFIEAVRTVAGGGTALDPEVVARMLGRKRRTDPLDALTPREREVLALMAEGLSNQGIADRLTVGPPAVEKHVTSIFAKLDLGHDRSESRRVLAVLTLLRARKASPQRRPAAARHLEGPAEHRDAVLRGRAARTRAPGRRRRARRRRPRRAARRRRRAIVTSTPLASACLTALVIASATKKYAAASTSGAKRSSATRSATGSGAPAVSSSSAAAEAAVGEHERVDAGRELAQVVDRVAGVGGRAGQRLVRASGARRASSIPISARTSRCCAPSCRSRPIRRRSASVAATMRARDAATSSASRRSVRSRNTTTAPRPSGVSIGADA